MRVVAEFAAFSAAAFCSRMRISCSPCRSDLHGATIGRTVKRIGGEPDDDLTPRDDDEDLPVVARLVVEIRSDGRRTIARGAAEDRASGQKVAIEARGDSPAQLALALARSLWKLPGLGAKRAVRGLLGRGRARGRSKP
jgi:hypothetical protein